MAREAAKAFWDARADESALFFVDNRLDYGDPDEEAFWQSAEEVLDAYVSTLDLRLSAEETVLDIGCGVGRLTRAAAARCAHVVGLDVSPRMLELARRYNAGLDNVSWVEGDGRSLQPVADASVDGCLSHVVFQHIPDPEVTLGYVREIGRVLRPGGWAAFHVSNDPRVHRGPGVRERLAGLARRGPRGQGHANWRGSAVDLDALRAAVADGGMELERLVGEGTQFCLARTRRR